MKTSEDQSKSAEESFVPDKALFKDKMGKLITQSLMLENGYNTELAVYTMTDTDKCYNGKLYPSLRRLYLETEDPTEYFFATKYLWGWNHWQRLAANSTMRDEVAKWREELEVRLRAKAVRGLIKQADSNFNAAKWVATGNWTSKRGRPSREEMETRKKIMGRIEDETAEESERIIHLVKKS